MNAKLVALMNNRWFGMTVLVLIVALVPGGMALAFALKTKLRI